MFESRKDFIAKAQAHARIRGVSDDHALHALARETGFRNWFVASEVMERQDARGRYHLDVVQAHWPRGMGSTTLCYAKHDPRPDARRIRIESGPMPGENGVLIHHGVVVMEGFDTPRDRRVVYDCQPDCAGDRTLPAHALNALFDHFLRDHRPQLSPEADRRRRTAQKLRALGLGMTNSAENFEDVWYLTGTNWILTFAAAEGHPLGVTEDSMVKFVMTLDDPDDLDDASKTRDVSALTIPLAQVLTVVRGLATAAGVRGRHGHLPILIDVPLKVS